MNKSKKIMFALGLLLLAYPISSQAAQSAEAVLEKYKESVVIYSVLDAEKSEIAQGTGFIIGKDLMVTNFHTISMAKNAEGKDFKGKKVKIEGFIAIDKDYDLALMKVKSKAPPLSPGNLEGLKFGSVLYAVGSDQGGDFTAFEGKIINMAEFEEGKNTIDLNASIPEDASGAPVFDAENKLVGIMLCPESRAKFVISADLLNNLNKTGAVTKFKKWEPVEYLETFEGAYLVARLFTALDSTSKAAKYLTKVLKMKPDQLDAQIMLASVYTKQRNYSNAVSAYKKVLELKPDLDSAYMGLGNVYFNMMNWNDAIPALEKAIEMNSANTQAYYMIGKAYQEQRIFDKAAEGYKKYLELNPQSPQDAHYQLGICLMEAEQYEGAITALQEALKSNPQDLTVNYKLAQSYQKAGQLEKAEELYIMLAQLSPEEAKIYFNTIIRMYDDAKMPDKAVAAAQKMIELDPNNYEAYYNLGAMYVKMKKFTDAAATFQKSIELRPDFDIAYANLGYSYSQLKKYSDAINAFKKMVEIVPDNSDGWFNLGINYMQLKKWADAVEPLKKAIELRPDYGVPYYNLGIVYLNLKDNYSAREIHKQLKAVNPEYAAKLQKYLR